MLYLIQRHHEEPEQQYQLENLNARILISDVVISSILTLFSPRILNIVAATPGRVIPTPTIETLAIFVPNNSNSTQFFSH